jgi:hypothetical protein
MIFFNKMSIDTARDLLLARGDSNNRYYDIVRMFPNLFCQWRAELDEERAALQNAPPSVIIEQHKANWIKHYNTYLSMSKNSIDLIKRHHKRNVKLLDDIVQFAQFERMRMSRL